MGEDVGSYAITTALEDPNGKLGDYSVTNTGAAFTIGPATPTVTVTDAGGTYTSLAFAATGAVTGVGGANLGMPVFTYFSGTYTTAADLDGLTALAGRRWMWGPTQFSPHTPAAWITRRPARLPR